MLFTNLSSYAQQTVTDSTKVETLDEVLIKSVRVDADSPITHSTVDKEEIKKEI